MLYKNKFIYVIVMFKKKTKRDLNVVKPILFLSL